MPLPFLNKHFLFICPRKDWDMISQWAFYLIHELLKDNNKVTLFCFKDGPLHQKLKDSSAQFLLYEESVSLKFWRWRQLDPLKQVIKTQKIDLIHCFDIRYIWPLNFILRKLPLIPLIHFQGEQVLDKYSKIWHQILKKRVDFLFVPLKENLKYMELQFNFPARKMDSIGLTKTKKDEGNNSFYNHLQWDLALEGPKLKEKFYFIGIDISSSASTESIKSLFEIFTFFKTHKHLDKEIKLFLTAKRCWDHHPFYGALTRLAFENDLKFDVIFWPYYESQALIKEMDIWLSLEGRPYINETILEGLSLGTQILAPKSWENTILKDKSKGMELYKSSNCGELFSKIKSLLQTQNDTKPYEIEFRPEIVFKSYQMSLLKRQRLFHKKLFPRSIVG